jgi:hypothetical protein
MSAIRRFTTAILATALVATIGVTLAQPASAAAPVTVDDHVTLYAGQARLIDVLKNDSDPDGDELAVCRVDPGEHEDYYVESQGGSLFVFTSPDATSDVTITYYACDFETLVPATLTISFKQIEPIQVEKLSRPDGRVSIPRNDSVVISVHRHRIDWVAIIAGLAPAGIGHVRDIDLPRGDRGPRGRVTLERSAAKVWAAQR